MTGELTVRVVGRTPAAESVILLDLALNAGGELAPWEPGSHIDVLLPRGGERQYSLIPSPVAGQWRIGVLREAGGRGGSTWLHDEVEIGRTIRVRGPRNHFAFAPVEGARYLFLAAGIGITPIASMLDAALAGSYEFHYSGRSRSSMAMLERFPDAVLHISDEGTRLDLPALVASLDPATEIYCCGPAHFIEAVEQAAGAHPLHVERFEARTFGEPIWNEPFEVELELSGETLTVEPGQSILEAVEDAGVFVLSSCREGTCGTCETPVISGEVEHRDSILTPDEQQQNAVMFICVSRAACPRLVLDL